MANPKDIDLTWDLSSFRTSVEMYRTRFQTALFILCETVAIKMENYAKEQAIWQDRTGNARQRLQGEARWVGISEIEIAVSHHMDYGYWLELAHQREYAILEEAIEENQDELFRAIKRLIGGLD